ncbi:MAG: hypothetical protein ABR976_18410 [Terracidiphilus sp.]|jgi:hypothetical protein
MRPQQQPNFPHRLNRNGFHDSICTRCHLTIASARNEADLASLEQIHVCNPIRLYQLQEDAVSQRANAF